MGFNIGDMLSGAITGFLETGDPLAAGAIGVMDGLTNNGASTAMTADSMLGGGSDMSTLMDVADIAGAFLA
jgi:hypothetical protein